MAGWMFGGSVSLVRTAPFVDVRRRPADAPAGTDGNQPGTDGRPPAGTGPGRLRAALRAVDRHGLGVRRLPIEVLGRERERVGPLSVRAGNRLPIVDRLAVLADGGAAVHHVQLEQRGK